MLICDGLLDYDCETGNLVWQPRHESHFKRQSAASGWNMRYAGTVAGSSKRNQAGKTYLTIRLAGKNVLAHRLIMNELGLLPDGYEVDHINGDGTDNRVANLRPVLRRENNLNIRMQSRNSIGVTGICMHRSGKKYRAFIIKNRQKYWLGCFKTIFDAAAARKSAELRMGFGPSHGMPMTTNC